MENKKYTSVDARPVKRFFVEMLTRDIQIEDAILDLLDNCVDGILRSQKSTRNNERPYDGFWAKINVGDDRFEIEDNCGGIPWSEHERAFRMGRPHKPHEQHDNLLSVGVYGIGMKRAIFKLGRSCTIITQHQNDSYQITFSEDWLNAEDHWDLEVEPVVPEMKEDGTILKVTNLNEDIKFSFSAEHFLKDLRRKIESHYSVIINKGFEIELNGNIVNPKPIVVRFADQQNGNQSVIRPYIFKGNYDEVEVFVTVGLREPIPGDTTEEEESVKFSRDYAGWTVICNDRVVLYCDRTELTGWGLGIVPRYHNQFIAIAGVVEFRGDPRKLPTTTTKRGLKFESSIYQQVLKKMMEGTKLFTNFTNKWKTKEREAEQIVSVTPILSYSEVKSKLETGVQDLKLSTIHSPTGLIGEQYKPNLPMPQLASDDLRISYTQSKSKILDLAEKLFPDEDLKEDDLPKRVGIESFNFAHKILIERSEL